MSTLFKLSLEEKQILVAIKDFFNAKPESIMDYLKIESKEFFKSITKLKKISLIYSGRNILKQELLHCTSEGSRLAVDYIEKIPDARPDEFEFWIAQPVCSLNSFSKSSFYAKGSSRVSGHL